MKIPKISVQYFPNKNITEQISSFIQKSIEQELRLINYHFRILFKDINISKCEVDSDILKNNSIFKIGRSPDEGIGFIGDTYNYILAIPEAEVYKLSYLNKITGDPERVVTISKGRVLERSKTTTTIDDIDENIEEILTNIESKLLGFRQKVSKGAIRPYIPSTEERQNINKIVRVLKTQKTITKISDAANLDEFEIQILKSISESYNGIKEAFLKFNNPTTASNVRTCYKSYIPTESNRSTLAFKRIGPNKEDISVSFITNKGKQYTVIKVSATDTSPYAFVISPEGTVQKNLPFVEKRTACSKKRKESVPDFYKTKELAELNIKQYLDCVNSELLHFKEHAINWRKKQLDFIAEHQNENVGSIQKYADKINKIYNSIENLKENIRKHYEYLAYSESYLRKNNIGITFSRRGILFEKITPEKYDLRITFPSVKGQKVTQLLVMDGDSIKDSFYIIDEKLLKLNFKNVNTAFIHTDRQRYYYSQDYIDQSRLGEYVDLICKYLTRANKIMTDKPANK